MKKWKKGVAWFLTLCMLMPAGTVMAEEPGEEALNGDAAVEGTSSGDVSGGETQSEENQEECAHEWGFDEELGKYDLEFHYLVCAKCGEKKKESHNFTGEFLGLKVCEAGCMVDPSLLENPGEDPEEENPGEETPGEENPEECTHEWGFDEELGNYDLEFHYLVCAKCGEKKKESHNFTGEFFGLKVCEAGCMVDPSLLEDPDEGDTDECSHRWKFDEELGNYDLEFHYLVCAKCGEKKKEAHTLTGNQFLGLEVCVQGCLLNLSGGEDQDPVEEEAFPIESYYTQRGSHSVKSAEFPVEEAGYSQYKIWYPADMETEAAKYPVIVMCNGTGSGYAEGMTDPEGYVAHFEHMASWGFIVVANDESDSFSGESAVKGAKLLLEMNDDASSIFCNKVDRERIGVTGHSQGGAGCLNAATKHGGQDIFKSIYSVSGANLGLATGLWGEGAAYDISQIQVPCCFAAGMGAFEDIVIPISELQANYDTMSADVPAVMMRRKNCEHGYMLTKSDGYLVAWFLYTLCGDGNAAKAFYGDGAEITVNTNWQDVQSQALDKIAVQTPEEPTPTPDEPTPTPVPGEPTPAPGEPGSSQETSVSNSQEEAADDRETMVYGLTAEAPVKAMNKTAQTLSDCIDTAFYSAIYPDLQEALKGNAALLKKHFLEYGLSEGRVAIPFLDIVGYKERYPDLQEAFGEDWGAYLKHYFVYGIKEGRSSGTWFDAAAYVERYPDLQKAIGYHPIALFNHYVKYGRKEGRNPSRDEK